MFLDRWVASLRIDRASLKYDCLIDAVMTAISGPTFLENSPFEAMRFATRLPF